MTTPPYFKMDKIRDWIGRQEEKYNLKRENVLAAIFAVVYTSLIVLDTSVFQHKLLLALWILIGVIITLFLSWLFVLAGFTVLKSLFLYSAELSLLIFLAQAYCNVPGHAADDALKMLVGVSVLYISYEFFVSLKDALQKKLKAIPDPGWRWEKTLIVGLFTLFTVVFIGMIYQVVNPILQDLCIYKVQK